MRLEAFDYELPDELVAQEPARERDAARLFVHRRAEDASEHRLVRDLPDVLAAGDLLVLNDTRVLPSRLLGRRASGGRVEVLLLEPRCEEGRSCWAALVNPARKLRPGEVVELEGGWLAARAIRRPLRDDGTPRDEWIVELVDRTGSGADDEELLRRYGRMPLPPYVHRSEREPDAACALDRERYQTIYARVPGAVAAPTAGLHFTPELLERLAARGVERAFVTLHVGAGTFRPVQSGEIERHEMHSERFELPAATVEAVRACRVRGGRVVAVGTTSARVLESCVDERGELAPRAGTTDLFLYPGRPLRAIDALLTNFHLPRSTLLMLVCAFAGRERTLRLYREAIERRYRFYSYGDAMLLA